jgi:hypothetical protein
MSKAFFLWIATVLLATSAAAQVEFQEQKDSVLVRVNGKDFTVLRFGANRYKPYLRPLLTASGKPVTRGYPDDPQPGEILTIPHQVGLYVGFEKLSGYDFNELDPSYDKKHRRGKIVIKEVKKMQGGPDQGVLDFTADWVTPEGRVLIEQEEELTFYAEPKNCRAMDMKIVLRPKDRVEFEDENDGIAALRLGAPFVEENGGRVFNFTGTEGANQVIGKRSPWIEYEGTLDGNEKVGVMVMDHPDNYNFPLRWKVRPWGLIYFSSFGEHEFYEEKSPPYDVYHGVPPNGVKDMGLKLRKDEALTFQFRILIHPLPMDLNAEWLKFAKPAAQ